MNTLKSRPIFLGCTVGWSMVALPLLAAGADSPWQATFSADALFNISAKFTGHPMAIGLTGPNDQPGAQNYDNGFVGEDVSGSPTESVYWGYNDKSQLAVSGSDVTGVNYQRTTINPGQSSPEDDSRPSVGGELTLRRSLFQWGRATVGLELGASYHYLDMKDASPYLADGQQTSYSYSLAQPLSAVLFPPSYAGTPSGGGPTINPSSETAGPTTVAPGAVAVSGTREVEANLFGFRFGPSLELPVGKRFTVSASAGALVMVVQDHVNWNESVTITTPTGTWHGSGSVSADGCGVTAGFYAGMDASYALSKHWSVLGGAKLEDAGTYTHHVGDGQVDLNLDRAVSLTLGMGYSF